MLTFSLKIGVFQTMLINLFIFNSSTKIQKLLRNKLSFNFSTTLSKLSMSSTAGDTDLTRKQGLLTVLEKNPKRFDRIKFLGRLFDSAGYELRIAGGAVRDILRGVEPQDIDFATTARPEQSLDILKKHEDILRIIVTAAGQKHGTVAVKFKETELDLKRVKLESTEIASSTISKGSNEKPEYDDESPYEITTLRCDNLTDGRHAEVEFISDWKIDAERRDLTINAMFLTLDTGNLIDYFGGESDLKSGIVRFVGDADLRIKEDYLRILRFFRFWSRYGRSNLPAKETMETIKANLSGLEKISGERIWQEIKKTFSALPCLEVVNLMIESGLPPYIGIIDENVIDQDYIKFASEEVERVQKNIQEYLGKFTEISGSIEKMDKRMKDLLPTIMFASIVQTPKMCLNAHKRMKFSNLERDSILYIVENRTKSVDLKNLKYDLALAHVPERIPIMSKMRGYLVYTGNFDLLEELLAWQIPNFPLTGNIVALEIRRRKLPGEKIKVIIEKLKKEWAESNFNMDVKELELKMFVKLDDFSKSTTKKS